MNHGVDEAFATEVEQYVQFEHKIVSAIWGEKEGLWNLKVQNPDGSVSEDFADILINASGILKYAATRSRLLRFAS